MPCCEAKKAAFRKCGGRPFHPKALDGYRLGSEAGTYQVVLNSDSIITGAATTTWEAELPSDTVACMDKRNRF
jgi:hypothetical protein